MSNPADRIAASVSRVVSQPPQRPRPEEPVDAALKRPEKEMPRADVLPEAKLSAGRRTRRSSRSTTAGSSTLHRTPITTTASMELCSTGSRSATPSTISIGTAAPRARSAADSRAVGSGSTASSAETVVG